MVVHNGSSLNNIALTQERSVAFKLLLLHLLDQDNAHGYER